MNRGRQLRLSAAAGDAITVAEAAPRSAHRLAHLRKALERHTRIERVIEVQRARKLRHR